MSLYKLLHFIFGEYCFETDKHTFSRFANILTESKLTIWKIRTNAEKVLFSSSIFAAEEIVKKASEAHIAIKIVYKKGLPFIFSRYRHRYGLFLGLVIAMFLMLWSQLFVWKIEISGNEEISCSEIEKALSECGIAVGSFIPEIDTKREANRLLLQCRDLSSVAINIKGTHIRVSVLERTYLPEIVDTSGYSNVVASRDGIIIDIDAANGTPEVREGDVVYKGELLINSFIKGTNGTYRPTHARGNVLAAVNEKFVCEIPFSRVVCNYTGKTETKRTFFAFGYEISLFSNIDSPYEYFDSVVSEKWINLFGFIELPIKEQRITYYEYYPEETQISEPQSEILARGELDRFLAYLDTEVLECETDICFDKEKGICRLEANAVVIQDIAKEVPFDIENQTISERLPIARE